MKVRENPSGYGISDGFYRFDAILLLMDTNVMQKTVLLFVTVLKSEFPIKRYRQPARSQNMRRSSNVYDLYSFTDIFIHSKWNTFAYNCIEVWSL